MKMEGTVGGVHQPQASRLFRFLPFARFHYIAIITPGVLAVDGLPVEKM